MATSSIGYSYGAPFFFVGGLLAFYVILIAVFYIFSSLGLYTMAKRRGLENPWLAWIPVVYLYVLGKLADTYAAQHMNKKTNYAVLLLALTAGMVALIIIMTIVLSFGMLNSYACSFWPVYIIFLLLVIAVSVVYAVFYFISLYRVYNWHSESATVLLVLSILFSIIIPFVLFALRNGDNRYLYPPQQPGGGQPYAPYAPYPQQPVPPMQQTPSPTQAPPQQQPPISPIQDDANENKNT